MKRNLVFAIIATTFVAAPAWAAPKKKAAPPPPPQEEEVDEAQPEPFTTNDSGLALGVRAGYALPFGTMSKDQSPQDLSKYVSGTFPLVLDAGYRISPHVYIGGFFQFAVGSTSSEVCAHVQGDCSSSATQLKVGPMIRYNLAPQKRFDPWIGAGAAFELLNLSVSQGDRTASIQIRGWEYGTIHLGGDIHIAKDVVIGPYASFGLGGYTSYDTTSASGTSKSSDFKNTGLHQWLTLGFRAEYDL